MSKVNAKFYPWPLLSDLFFVGGFVVVVMVSLSMIIDWNASFGVSLSVVGFIVD